MNKESKGDHFSDKKPLSYDVTKSQLSPFAQEFVPRYAIPVVNDNSNNYVINYSWNNYDQTTNGESYDSSKKENDLEPDDYVALNELKEFIDIISSQPAQYEDQLDCITATLNLGMEEDADIIMQCVVNTIVDQAIMDQNFRYNGVRLCVHLIDNLKKVTSKGTFKDILLQRCQREHSRREALAVATDGGLYLRGVALFIADLSTRVQSRDMIQALPELIDTLLLRPTTGNLKCACMILKLCGSILDEQFKQPMDRIFDRLKSFETKKTNNSSTISLIQNVTKLRSSGWVTGTPAPSTIPNPYAAGGPVCENYETYDGTQGGGGGGVNDYAGYGYDFGSCGDETDLDVCNSFESFLRSSGQLK